MIRGGLWWAAPFVLVWLDIYNNGVTLIHMDNTTTPSEPILPEPGTYAYTARVMAELMPDFDWDAWKDEQKEGGL
jgi:hypothetical protein